MDQSNMNVSPFSSNFIIFCRTLYKHGLILFRGHDLQYTCLCLNLFAVIFEVIIWHALYGSQGFVILNSIYQVIQNI